MFGGGIGMSKNVYSIKKIRSRLSPIFSGYNVRSAILFGSYAKGCATEKSDIDLLVDSSLRGLQFFALFEDIREALDDKQVDLLDVTHIDSGSKIQQEIQNTGVRIYG